MLERRRESVRYRGILLWAEVAIDAPEGFDFDVARQKIEKQLAEVDKHAAQHEARLNDERFMTKADPETRAEVAQRFEELQAQRKLLTEQLRQLEERARKKKLVVA